MLKKDLLLKVRIFLIFTSSLFILGNSLHAQSVGISDTSDFTPDTTALLEMRSIQRGFLMPRMTRAQRVAIVSPVHGLMVVQTNDTLGEPSGIWYYNSNDTQWHNIFTTSTSVLFSDITTATNITATMTVGTGAQINLSGTGIVESNKFLGSGSTSDSVDLNTAEVGGILPVAKGGTGVSTTPPAGGAAYGNGSTIAYTAAGTAGQVLVSDGTNPPSWQETPLPDLADSKIWIGDNTSNAVAYSVSGDGTLSNAGVLAVTKIRGTLISATAPTDNQILKYNSSNTQWEPVDLAAGGTVTSVGLALPTEFTVSGSPVINSGTLTGAWANQNQNLVFSSPDGSSGTPSFRSLVSDDIPDLDAGKITTGTFTASQIPNLDAGKITTGIFPVSRGGTGISTTPSAGSVAYGNGTTLGYTAVGTSGQVLVSAGSGTPVWLETPLPVLANTKIWIGNASNQAIANSISGDITLSNAGAVTVTKIQNQAVSNAWPGDDQYLIFNQSNNQWEPTTIAPTWILNGTKLYPNPLNDWYSLQWGNGNSSGSQSTAFGGGAASGYRATAWGTGTTATQNLSTAWGSSADATANLATAWGENTTASANLSTVWGSANTASGNISTAWGSGTLASGEFATAFGQNTTATAGFTTVWGDNTDATSQYATAYGQNSLASGQYATAFGLNSIASGIYSTALGQSDTASGTHALAFGQSNKAQGNYSLSFGQNTNAQGIYSTTWGLNTTAYSGMETVFGQFNTVYSPTNSWGWSDADRLFVLGNGASNASRSNALVVYKKDSTDLFGNFSIKSNNTSSKELRLFESSTNGTNYTGFKADTLTSNLVYTMPKDTNNELSVLVNYGTNKLKWMKTGDLQSETRSNILEIIDAATYNIPDTVTHVLVERTGISRVNLYSGSAYAGKVIFIKRLSGGTYHVQICPASGEKIDRSGTSDLNRGIQLRNQYDSAMMVYDGSNWWIMTAYVRNNQINECDCP